MPYLILIWRRFFEDIFDVENIEQVNDEEYSVIGRAIETIKVGDTVYGIVGRKAELIRTPDSLESVIVDPGTSSEENTFTVSKIMTYGHSVEEISRSLTGKLSLAGKPTMNFSNITMLAKKESGDFLKCNGNESGYLERRDCRLPARSCLQSIKQAKFLLMPSGSRSSADVHHDPV